MQVCPGVQELVKNLEQQNDGFINGLLTGNAEVTGLLKTRLAGFEERVFKACAFGCQASDRTHLPPLAIQSLATALSEEDVFPHSAVIVGDTVRDILCAHAHGLPCIAVGTGGTSLEVLQEHIQSPWDRVFDDLRDTEEVMRHLQWLVDHCPPNDLCTKGSGRAVPSGQDGES